MNKTNPTKKPNRMNKNAKRILEPCFTPDESYLLERLVHKHESILKDKGMNVRSLWQRKGIWKIITKEFNAEGLNVMRSVDKLQKRWYNQKSFRKNKPSSSILSKFKRTSYYDYYPESTGYFHTEIKDKATQNAVEGDNSNDSEHLGVNYSVKENNGFMNIIKEMYIATQNAVKEGVTNDEEHFGINNSVDNNIGLTIVIKEIDMAIKDVVEEVYSGITDDLDVTNSIEENSGFMSIIKETLINRNL